MPRLIVNADDLGYSEGVTDGILDSHERGIVTSASLIVEGADAERAVELARSAHRPAVGLHAVLAADGESTLEPSASRRCAR